jgi:urease accessory protein
MKTQHLINSKVSVPQKLERASGNANIRFKILDGQTRLDYLYQSGCCKIRFPKVHKTPLEAVFLNTAGGLTGGDEIHFSANFKPDTEAVISTQACERIYKSSQGNTVITNTLRLGPGSRACWLPQETILFDGGRLDRTLDVEISGDATFLGVESVIFGRTEMREEVHSGFLYDRWRIRRDGKPLFADNTFIEGAINSKLSNPALLDGGRCISTVILIADTIDELLVPSRDFLSPYAAGISVVNGVLVGRIVATTGLNLREVLLPLLNIVRGGVPLPRVWCI